LDVLFVKKSIINAQFTRRMIFLTLLQMVVSCAARSVNVLLFY